jgi:hypothetical protein
LPKPIAKALCSNDLDGLSTTEARKIQAGSKKPAK